MFLFIASILLLCNLVAANPAISGYLPPPPETVEPSIPGKKNCPPIDISTIVEETTIFKYATITTTLLRTTTYTKEHQEISTSTMFSTVWKATPVIAELTSETYIATPVVKFSTEVSTNREREQKLTRFEYHQRPVSSTVYTDNHRIKRTTTTNLKELAVTSTKTDLATVINADYSFKTVLVTEYLPAKTRVIVSTTTSTSITTSELPQQTITAVSIFTSTLVQTVFQQRPVKNVVATVTSYTTSAQTGTETTRQSSVITNTMPAIATSVSTSPLASTRYLVSTKYHTKELVNMHTVFSTVYNTLTTTFYRSTILLETHRPPTQTLTSYRYNIVTRTKDDSGLVSTSTVTYVDQRGRTVTSEVINNRVATITSTKTVSCGDTATTYHYGQPIASLTY